MNYYYGINKSNGLWYKWKVYSDYCYIHVDQKIELLVIPKVSTILIQKEEPIFIKTNDYESILIDISLIGSSDILNIKRIMALKNYHPIDQTYINYSKSILKGLNIIKIDSSKKSIKNI